MISSNKNPKNGKGHYPAIFIQQAWPVKDLLYQYGQENFFLVLRTEAADTKKVRRYAHVAHLGSQSEHKIHVVLPSHRSSRMKRNVHCVS